MSFPARKRATYKDVLTASDSVVAELIDGDLSLQPRPARPHSQCAWELGSELGNPFARGKNGPGGWVFLYEPELHLNGDVLVPDVGAWRKERMQSVPYEVSFISLAPDWVCEILSPSTLKQDRGTKMNIYARERVSFLWLIDPVERYLEAYRLNELQWQQLGTWRGDGVACIEPFDAVGIELRFLWGQQ